MGILRLLLALSVVAQHCNGIFGLQLVGGQLAVQSFYLISGFYMSLILNEKYIGTDNSYRLFVTNRFLKIYPIYWTVLLLAIAVNISLWVIGRTENAFIIQNYLDLPFHLGTFIYFLFSQIGLFTQDIALFAGLNNSTGALFFTTNFASSKPPVYSFLFIPQAWTLGVELMFYLIAPFLLRRRVKWILAVILISLAVRFVTFYLLDLHNDPWTYRFFPSEIAFFFSGSLAYRIYKKAEPFSFIRVCAPYVLACVVIATIGYDAIPKIEGHLFSFTTNQLLYFIMIFLSVPILFNRFKSNKLDIKTGEFSYPVYVCHIFVAIICYSTQIPILQKGETIMAGSLVFALILNRFIQKPLDDYRQSRLHVPKSLKKGDTEGFIKVLT
jgi:peptidoglycan/LPS O-acetylase OafA/YrhL